MNLSSMEVIPCWKWAGRHREYDCFTPSFDMLIENHPRWAKVAKKGITVYLEVQTRGA